MSSLARILRDQRVLLPLCITALLMLALVTGSTLTREPALPVLGIPVLVIALAMLRRPLLAIVVFFFQLPFTSPLFDSFFPAKLQGGRPFLMLLLISVAHAWIFRNTIHRKITRLDGLVLLFLGLTFASLFRAVIGFDEVFDLYLASTLTPLAIYFAIRPLPLRPVDIDRVLNALAMAAVLIAVLLCIERVIHINPFNPTDYLVGWNLYATEATYRASGPFINPNNAGAFLAMGAVLLVSQSRRRSRALTNAALGVIAVAIFFTLSRAAYLSLALLFLVGQMHRGRLTRMTLGVCGGCVVAVLLAPLSAANETVRDGVLNPSSWLYRLTLVDTAWRMVSSGAREILFGFGYENFRYLAHEFAPESFAPVPQIRGAGMPVHNDLLAMLIHYGLLGFAAFALLIGRVLARGLRLRRAALRRGDRAGADRVIAVLAIVLVQLVMSVSHVPFTTYQLATLFWFAVVILEHHEAALIAPAPPLSEQERAT